MGRVVLEFPTVLLYSDKMKHYVVHLLG